MHQQCPEHITGRVSQPGDSFCAVVQRTERSMKWRLPLSQLLAGDPLKDQKHLLAIILSFIHGQDLWSHPVRSPPHKLLAGLAMQTQICQFDVPGVCQQECCQLLMSLYSELNAGSAAH